MDEINSIVQFTMKPSCGRFFPILKLHVVSFILINKLATSLETLSLSLSLSLSFVKNCRLIIIIVKYYSYNIVFTKDTTYRPIIARRF